MSEVLNYIFNIGLSQYLILALSLFLVGLLIFVLAHDVLKMVVSLIFIFNSVCINFFVFSTRLNNIHFIGETVNTFIALVLILQIITLFALCVSLYLINNSNSLEKAKETGE